MGKIEEILYLIKNTVKSIDSTAVIILYGSYARKDNNDNSDIDLLILINKPNLTSQETKNIKYPLYNIEFEYGKIISPLVLTRNDWETKHRITPFYENVVSEGIVL